LTPPKVSMPIRKLTGAVGLPFFKQFGKKPYRTDAGRSLYKFSCEIFERFSCFEMTIADMRSLKQGKLRLAMVTTAKYLVPLMLGKFCQRYPGVDVSPKVSNRERVFSACQRTRTTYISLASPQTQFPPLPRHSWKIRW